MKTAKENLFHSKLINKKYYDKNSKETKVLQGSKVLLFDSLNTSHFNRKFNSTYRGPYEVIQIHSNNTASIKIAKNKIRTYHLNKLKPYIVSDDQQNHLDCNINSCGSTPDGCSQL